MEFYQVEFLRDTAELPSLPPNCAEIEEIGIRLWVSPYERTRRKSGIRPSGHGLDTPRSLEVSGSPRSFDHTY